MDSRLISFFRWSVLMARYPFLTLKTFSAWIKVSGLISQQDSIIKWVVQPGSTNWLAYEELQIAHRIIRPVAVRSTSPCLRHALTLYDLSPCGGLIRFRVKKSDEFFAHAEFSLGNSTFSLNETWNEAPLLWEHSKT